MKMRIERFVDAFFVPTALQAASDADAGSIVVVAHGIILNVLLRVLLACFGPEEVAKLAKPGDAPWRSEWLASWSNTGYLEADLRVTTPVAGPALSTHPSEVKSADSSAAVNTSAVQEHGHSAARFEEAVALGQPKTALASASNTTVPTPVPDSSRIHLHLRTINCIEHLQGLKKTRGGIGSAGHDEKQKTMDSFFSRPAKKPNLEEGGE